MGRRPSEDNRGHKRKRSTVDAFVNQVPLDYRIRAISRHGRLHRTAQGNRKDDDG